MTKVNYLLLYLQNDPRQTREPALDWKAVIERGAIFPTLGAAKRSIEMTYSPSTFPIEYTTGPRAHSPIRVTITSNSAEFLIVPLPVYAQPELHF